MSGKWLDVYGGKLIRWDQVTEVFRAGDCYSYIRLKNGETHKFLSSENDIDPVDLHLCHIMAVRLIDAAFDNHECYVDCWDITKKVMEFLNKKKEDDQG